MKNIDTLIHARWVIPVEPNVSLPHHSVAVQHGVIVDILPTASARERYHADDSVDLPTHALIPGLVNAHTHAAMTLFRGLADDLPLMDWLQNHIWPAEGRWVGPDFVRDGTRLAVAEMLKGGTTCFNDMYFFPQDTADVARAAGMRAVVGLIMIDFPTAYAANPEEYLERGLALHDALRHDSLIRTSFAPHAPYTVSDGPLERIRTLNNELNLPIHIHLHETAHEVDEALAKSARRPLQRLETLDLLTPNLVAVHMTQLTQDDIHRVARGGVHVVHCPESNLKLASGFCPVHDLLQAGINVALGTDGAASNNDLDMLGEMRSAALLAKAVSRNAVAVSAHQALRMATVNGARALGLEEHIGTLAPHKAADITAIDLQHVASQPVYDPVSQIVYSAGRDQVSDVWVAGKRLLHTRRLTTLDENAVLTNAAAWHAKISA
jgi:5-methylthioadenosine/S-adenosylhomocysteine deaminase